MEEIILIQYWAYLKLIPYCDNNHLHFVRGTKEGGEATINNKNTYILSTFIIDSILKNLELILYFANNHFYFGRGGRGGEEAPSFDRYFLVGRFIYLDLHLFLYKSSFMLVTNMENIHLYVAPASPVSHSEGPKVPPMGPTGLLI